MRVRLPASAKARASLAVLVLALACVFVAARTRLSPVQEPPRELTRWALHTLAGAARQQATPAPPSVSHRAPGPTIILAWHRGEVIARHVGEGDLGASVRAAARAFAGDERVLRASAATQSKPRAPAVYFTITLLGEHAPWMRSIALLTELSVVPLVEAVGIEHRGKRAYATPDELLAEGLWDSAIDGGVPDLTFGLSPRRVAKLLAPALGAPVRDLLEEGNFERFAARTLTRSPYPRDQAVTIKTLERAASEAVRFLLRHQARSGRYTYRYDAHRGRVLTDRRYSLPRHGGTTFFLAQAARVLSSQPARAGAQRALSWVRKNALRQCGSGACVGQDERPDMGSSALSALAAAELLRSGDDPDTRALLEHLTAFIRSMQRPDGELMHVYDLTRERPIDVQKLYFSGEAAFALLASYKATGEARDLETAQKLMHHLTGAGWSFFGSRYFYGEEHWTCQATAAAQGLMPTDDAFEFCLRWLDYQRELLYAKGDTPWSVAGAIGVGPVLVPRITAVASRVEAGAMIYSAARKRGVPVRELRAHMEQSLGFLLRMRWSPGPLHVLRSPEAALGGVPATQASLEVRNDFVQHAGSAMLSWLEQLRIERAAAGRAGVSSR